MPRSTPHERFHAKVDYGDIQDGCWLWTGSTTGGYGQICIGGRTRFCHRVAYEWADCDIPEGMVVMHICDTPACVRPTHLRLGTDASNMADKVVKGRQSKPRGARNGMAVVTDADVAEIRRLAKRQTQASIGVMYAISPAVVSLIVNRKTWRHLP